MHDLPASCVSFLSSNCAAIESICILVVICTIDFYTHRYAITESIMQILVHSYRMFNLVTNFRTKNNLFTFQVGFSHSRILRTVIQHACSRFPSLVPCNNAWTALSRKLQSSKQAEAIHKGTSKQKVFVIFGGDTSERQVSLMSGTNVWLNLQSFDDVRSLVFNICSILDASALFL